MNRKWIIQIVLVFAVLLASCSQNISPQQSTQTNKNKNQAEVRINQTAQGDEAFIPITKQQGEEYVGLRELMDVLKYRAANKRGTYLIGDTGTEYEIRLNDRQVMKNGETFGLSDAPVTINGQPHLPISAINELFNEDMSYKFADGQLIIEEIGEEGFGENENVSLQGEAYDFADDPTDPLKNVDIEKDTELGKGTIQAQALKNIDINNLLKTARSYLGVRYVFGSEYPDDRTFDCSSYTQYVFAQHGIKLPRTARAQGKVGKTVSRKSLRKGDLLFFYIPGRFKSKSIPGHVGIYIGNGRMIHALNEPKDGVQYRSINIPFWKKNFLWAKRVAY